MTNNISNIDNRMYSRHAFDALANEIANDLDYAWGWHCNIAVVAMDEGLDHKSANRAASRFMYSAFKVDTTKCKYYNSTQQ